MKRGNRWFVIIAFSALVIGILTACGGGAPRVDWELTISGAVENPTTLTYKELTQMEQTELTDIMMEKSTGEDEVTSWSGVPVDLLFEEAGVGDYPTVTAIAGDGYAIDITSDELQGAIVALKRGEQWITDAEPDKGPIRLVCPETPANRWVFQLQELQVNP
jgi:DMSO/TMAO reductase YedYZ molybdopterin-dependent catalytic subunit